MAASPIVAAAPRLLVAALHASAWPVALPFVLLWYAAPLIAFSLSRPSQPVTGAISDDDRAYLQGVAHSRRGRISSKPS